MPERLYSQPRGPSTHIDPPRAPCVTCAATYFIREYGGEFTLVTRSPELAPGACSDLRFRACARRARNSSGEPRARRTTARRGIADFRARRGADASLPDLAQSRAAEG